MMMATDDFRIRVNGVGISQKQINAEVQYHKASSLPAAKQEAMKALVIRELLLQRAADLALCDRKGAIEQPDAVIERLLQQEVQVPEPDAESCRRFYENNRKRFYTAPLFEAAHIFFPAPPGDKPTRDKVRNAALDILKKLQKKPSAFEKLAREFSACPSAAQGGHLGQISTGQTVPAFEAAMLDMKEGDMSQTPVESEVGFHIIRVHKRVDGRELPFDAVEDWISSYLQQQSWNRAVHQYIQLLAGQAKIEGYDLPGAESPLVQ